MIRISTENEGAYAPAQQKYLHVTLALAAFDVVLPAVAGLFRATHGYTRAVENSTELLWARFDRMERHRGNGPASGPNALVRIIEPKDTPAVTVIEDPFGCDPDHLAALLPQVGFLSLSSEYHQKSAERHSYTLRQRGKVERRVYVHHNYQISGWNWHATGPVQPWEDAGRLAAKRISNRCDRALLIDYAAALGCDLHGALAGADWTRAITLHQVEEDDLREVPPPIDWGEAFREKAITAGFGRGEEDLTFEGLLAENRFFACLADYSNDTTCAIQRTRSAKGLLTVMRNRDPSPDWQDHDSVDQGLWNVALTHAYQRFPDAPEMTALEHLATEETRAYRFPLTALRLRNLKAGATGHPQEPDPDMLVDIATDAAGTLRR